MFFCYQTFLKSICFLIHPMLLTYLEVFEEKNLKLIAHHGLELVIQLEIRFPRWVCYQPRYKEEYKCRMSSVLCMWLSSQRAGGTLERSLLSASREGVTAATRTAADPKSGPALKPCRLSLWWAGGIYSKLIKMLTKRILLLSNCFWSGKIWTGWD